MNADKLRRIELVGHPSDGFPKQVRVLPSNVQADIIRRRLDPVDLVDLDKHNPSARLDNQPILRRTTGCIQQVREAFIYRAFGRLAHLIARAFQSAVQTFLIEGLQQIVKGVFFECLQGIAVVSRGEDHNGALIRRQIAKYIEPGAAFHFYVEQQNVGPMRADGMQSIFQAGTFSHDLHFRLVIEQHAQFFA